MDGEIGDNQLAKGILGLPGINIIKAISGSNNVVENHGVLILTGTSGDNNAKSSYVDVFGFWIRSDVTAEAGTTRFGNWGTISATATTGAGSVYRPAWAAGIYTANLLGESNTIENHGTIVARSTASDENNDSRAYGLAFKSANSGTEVYNTGVIDVSVNAPKGRAVGIGNFSGAAVPGEPGLYAPGRNPPLAFEVIDGENVTTYRLYDAEIEQGGVRLRYFVPETFDGTVRNEGKIVARASNGADAFAIYLGQQSDPDLDGWLELSTLGFLEGRIRTGSQNILVDNSMPSHSVYWTVEDSAVVNEPTYTEPDLLSDEPSEGGTGNNTFQYFIVDDLEQTTSVIGPPDWADGDARAVGVLKVNANTRATYDTSLMAMYGTLIDHAATIGSAQEAARLSAVAAAAAAAARDSGGEGGDSDGEGGSTFGLSLISGGNGDGENGGGENDEDGGWQAWATGFGGQLELDGSDRDALDASGPYTGLSAGIICALGDTDLGVNGAVSFSFGSLQSNMDFNSRWMRSQESDVQTIFTDVAASFAPGASPAGGLQIGASLRVGRTRLDNTRHVNNNLVPGGIETNIGSTDALWLAVAGDIGYRIAAGDAASITPFARVSHVQGTIDGYSETGGQSAAIIGDQEIAVTRGETRLRGSVDLAGEAEARLLGSVSAFFSSESGDDSVAVTLGTDTRDLVFTQLDDNGVRASLGLEYGFDNGTSLFAGGNYSASDAGDTDLSAGLTLRFPL